MNLIIRHLHLIIICLAALMPAEVAASVTISKIPGLDGMPDKGIERVFRDSDGYMWYVTRNGLCRDDGYRTVTLSPPY